MQSFPISRIVAKRAETDRAWLEFLRVATLSVGIYHLKAGQADPQRPHTEDEVYYTISGRASFLAGKEKQAVEPGTIIYVECAVEHRFYDIVEDLTLLVFFAPPEGSLKN